MGEQIEWHHFVNGKTKMEITDDILGMKNFHKTKLLMSEILLMIFSQVVQSLCKYGLLNFTRAVYRCTSYSVFPNPNSSFLSLKINWYSIILFRLSVHHFHSHLISKLKGNWFLFLPLPIHPEANLIRF